MLELAHLRQARRLARAAPMRAAPAARRPRSRAASEAAGSGRPAARARERSKMSGSTTVSSSPPVAPEKAAPRPEASARGGTRRRSSRLLQRRRPGASMSSSVVSSVAASSSVSRKLRLVALGQVAGHDALARRAPHGGGRRPARAASTSAKYGAAEASLGEAGGLERAGEVARLGHRQLGHLAQARAGRPRVR